MIIHKFKIEVLQHKHKKLEFNFNQDKLKNYKF
jgi:hypothetical protein